jgi:hypothetical protein
MAYDLLAFESSPRASPRSEIHCEALPMAIWSSRIDDFGLGSLPVFARAVVEIISSLLGV